MNRIYKKIISQILILSLTLPLTACSKASDTEAISKNGFFLDTYVNITLYGSDKEDYLDECMNMLSTYESYFSNTISDSDISRINASPYQGIEVHDETAELISLGLNYSESSGGIFDITVGKLSSLWDFHAENPTLPSEDKIKEAISTIDYTCVSVDGNIVTLNSDQAMIDLGGIAKGYIADKLKEYLINEGIHEGLINLGGNVLSVGPKTKQDSSSYKIGLQKPFSEDGDVIAAVTITDESVVTSGIYQRYFEANGKIYHHLLNTSTGYPENNGLNSVTIISDQSVDGDALSTIVYLMGKDEGLKYVEATDGIEAIFIDSENEITYSSGIGSKIPFEIVK